MTKLAKQTVSVPATKLVVSDALQAISAEFASAEKQVLNLSCSVCLAYIIGYTLIADDKARPKLDTITKQVKETISAELLARARARFLKSFPKATEEQIAAKVKPGQSTLELYLTFGRTLHEVLGNKGHLAPGGGLLADIASSETAKDALAILVTFMGHQEVNRTGDQEYYYSAGVITVDDLRVYLGGNARKGAGVSQKAPKDQVADKIRSVMSPDKGDGKQREVIANAMVEATPQDVKPHLIIHAAEALAKLAAGGNQKAMDALETVTKRIEAIRDNASEALLKHVQAQRKADEVPAVAAAAVEQIPDAPAIAPAAPKARTSRGH